MDTSLPDSIFKHLSRVTSGRPGISEIWLIGSRANATARADSDWDFIVFADSDTLHSLRSAPELARSDIDLLIVVDGDRFESPWPRSDNPGKYKRGHLQNYTDPDGVEHQSLEWTRLSESEAEYIGGQMRIPSSSGAVKFSRARRIYDRCAHGA